VDLIVDLIDLAAQNGQGDVVCRHGGDMIREGADAATARVAAGK
jgi:hypothetical protein